jgi:hypothetical protein
MQGECAVKLYTTSQAIRILERYPDRGYVFEAPKNMTFDKMLLRFDGKQLLCIRVSTNSLNLSMVLRPDWLLVRPKQKRGRSVVIGRVMRDKATNQSNGLCKAIESIPDGTWKLIAVEVVE